MVLRTDEKLHTSVETNAISVADKEGLFSTNHFFLVG